MRKKTITTKYHKITREWWFDVVPLTKVGGFMDYCLEAISDIYPLPDEKIVVEIGFKEGNYVENGGYMIKIANNFGEKLSSYSCFAAAVRMGDAFEDVFPHDFIDSLIHKIQKDMRSEGIRGWLREFFWFSSHWFRSAPLNRGSKKRLKRKSKL